MIIKIIRVMGVGKIGGDLKIMSVLTIEIEDRKIRTHGNGEATIEGNVHPFLINLVYSRCY